MVSPVSSGGFDSQLSVASTSSATDSCLSLSVNGGFDRLNHRLPPQACPYLLALPEPVEVSLSKVHGRSANP